MNILVFSWRDPKHPLAGGAEQVMHEHMKGWVNAGHSVTLFASHFKGGSKEENIDGVTLIRRGTQLLGVQILGFFYYLLGKHPKFDLVVDQFHGIPFFTPFYVRCKKIAVLQEVAKEVWLMNDLPKPLNLIIGSIGYFLEPFIFLFYTNIPFITGSDSAKLDLITFGIPEKKISVVPHGVLLSLPKTLPAKEKMPTLIYLGALTKDKGIEDAIKAISLLPNITLWAVGIGSKENMTKWNSLVRKLNLGNRVKFFGFVDQARKFELLSKAHLLINPSVREGWGLVNIEANSVGTPVVAYKSAGLVDSVKDGVSGVFCEENNPKEMAKEVDKILADQDKYKLLSKSSKDWSKNFTWEKSRKKSLELLESLK